MSLVGTYCFGHVDRVPGTGYVVTRFVHYVFLPLVPCGSYIVLEGSEAGSGFRGVRIRPSTKSILTGYIRVWGSAGAVIASAWAGAAGAVTVGGKSDIWELLGIAFLGLNAVIASVLWNRYFLIPLGLVVLASLGFLVAMPPGTAPETVHRLQILTACANGLLILTALTRAFDRASPDRSQVLLDLIAHGPVVQVTLEQHLHV